MLEALNRWIEGVGTDVWLAALAVAFLAFRTYLIRWEFARCTLAEAPLRRLRTDLLLLFLFWICQKGGLYLPSALPREPSVAQMADYLARLHGLMFWNVLTVTLIFGVVLRFLGDIDRPGTPPGGTHEPDAGKAVRRDPPES